VPWEPIPVYRLSLDPREEEELRHSAELMTRWEGADRVRTFERHELATVGLRDSFSYGVHLRSDFVFAPGSLVSALEGALEGRVRRGTGSYVITGVQGGQLELHHDGNRLQTEIAVVAGGAGSAAAHPWLTDAIIPVRIHRSSFPAGTSSGAQTATPLAGLCRDRFESWVQRPDGLQFAGCRWAEGPDLGATKKPNVEVLSAVVEAQDSFIKRHLTENPDWSAGLRDAAVTDFSCDGLPLIGPLPGSPRVLAMCGWNGWGFSAIGAAVAELTGAILGEPAPMSSPQALLHPRRML
jgi:glycine/D-amino acid oxidase-like deaminating enzyme